MKYIVSLDVGTSSVRTLIFSPEAQIKGIFQIELKSSYPKIGWVEQDPQELWEKSQEVVRQAGEFCQKNNLAIGGLAITNQRETIIAWSKKTGQAIYQAIGWQDRRTAEECQKLVKRGFEDKIYRRTGLCLDPYFSASKIKWIITNVPQAKKLIRKNDLLVGTVDTWMIWNFTKGQQHVTDVSNASRTMLFNINSLVWDNDLLKIFRIPQNILPTVKASFSVNQNFGLTTILDEKIPILAVCGDQTSALYGEQCFKKGQTKITYGTGGFVVVNAGEKIKLNNPKIITTIAWQINKTIVYALEGSIFQSGGSLKWLRDNLGLFKDYTEANLLSEQTQDSKNVYFVPALTGLGSPHWLPQVQGLIRGLTNQTTAGHLVNAAVESAAFQVDDILETIKKNYKIKIKSVKVDGGLTKNKHLLDFQAGISRVRVFKSVNSEMTGWGVASLAGQSLKWPLVPLLLESETKFQMSSQQRKEKKTGWKKNIGIVLNN
ncbi:MAG TPA: glycerol kinase GlpK [Candidatus Magasanikbacteria bacterium]|nr:glycerol kinase GlpK [Candidatus Magasanikbacteria bacterium]